jgi:hypothetical protein
MDWDTYQNAKKAQEKKIMSSPRFTTLAKEYSNTAFYKEAVNTCSYLADFVRKVK